MYKTIKTTFLLLFISFLNITQLNAENLFLNRSSRAAVVSASQNQLIDSCPEVRSLCNIKTNADNLEILECISSFLTSHLEGLSDECQHSIWTHTSEIVNDANVLKITQKKCEKDLDRLNCKVTKKPGQLLACFIDHREEIKNVGCRELIQRLELVAFSDYRLIGSFVQDCEHDIGVHSCGRLNTDRDTLSQGETIACLQNHIESLESSCRKGILHVSELQGDNIKADRQLFLACIVDTTRFCPDARPGSGTVYKCLMRNKNDPNMSRHCQEQLLRRDKLIARDYKVSRGLARSCKEDIKNNHCRRGVSEDKDVRLAQILLCLEAAQKNNTKISPECTAEMTDHRKLLMEDFHLSPEILTGCADDIQKFCNNLESGGKTIHCLMEHARPKKKKDRRVTAQCQRSLESLVKITDVGEDWRVDPVLRRACKPVVDIACRDTDGGNARVMSCLMEKLGTNYMTDDCETALMQIQYFVARDFKLDPQLYKNCKEDAVKFCKAKKTWSDPETGQMDPERGPLILPCLHRYAYHPEKDMQLKDECFQEVKRVMRQRAVSVDLIPEVEDDCLDDLATYCFDKTAKGEEMQCMQDNLESLQEKCRKAIINYTEEEAGHFELNPVLMSACKESMEKHCNSILKTGKDEGDMMECLISHKNDPDLRNDLKCRAAIEHFQLISLKNYHFTYKFKEACRPHVIRFCSSSNTKYDVVACLSEVMRNDTIKGQRHSIPKECRQQIRAQLYQQRENIDFDPKLKSACHEEIENLCMNIPHDSGQVLECLQTNRIKLGDSCRHAIFAIKKSELTDSGTDYTLINTCKDMLERFCRDKPLENALHCLKTHKDEPKFDQKCHLVVVNRMIEQNMDYRFNPLLQEACAQNIASFCTTIVASAKQNEELNGDVINCLKNKFREGLLTLTCQKQMTEVLHEQALNYKLNPLLQSVCSSEIEILCKPSDENNEDNGEVEECLKNAFLNHKVVSQECKFEVAMLIEESRADIHVDPVLQKACTVDLLKYCSEVNSGNGRKLRCLQVILADESKALDEDCKQKLRKRMEMYKNALLIVPPVNFVELYSQVVTSPAKRAFLLTMLTFVAIIFIFGIFCGRVTRRSQAMKNK